jgi:diadenosine tetraphosphate (Ap4A) HIT family hydrolase
MNFESYKIKDYSRWELYLHQNQYYLGRTYIWAKREDAADLMNTTPEEQKELFAIGKELNGALTKLFRPDLMNYASLGNIDSHLHLHVIPRYASPRIFEGTTFTDEQWGKNYAPYNYDFRVPEDILQKIKDSINKVL